MISLMIKHVPQTVPLKLWRQWVSDGAYALVGSVSGMVIVGYITRDEDMIKSWIFPHHVGMALQTAVCLFIMALANLFSPRNHPDK